MEHLGNVKLIFCWKLALNKVNSLEQLRECGGVSTGDTDINIKIVLVEWLELNLGNQMELVQYLDKLSVFLTAYKVLLTIVQLNLKLDIKVSTET